MQVVRVFADLSGESHFEDRNIAFSEVGYGRASGQLPVTGVIFRQTPAGAHIDFHNPPKRQLIIFLQGEAELEASDGSTKRLGPGDILMTDDTTGRGHRLQEADGRLVAVVPLPDDFNIETFLPRS